MDLLVYHSFAADLSLASEVLEGPFGCLVSS